METVRVFFAKEGRLKYISHLDVTRCLARVFKRSGLPIWYTQGFNPHAYLTFALPLPLGVESRCESFDFRLTEEVSYEEVKDRLNAVLPDDLRALRAAAPVMSAGAGYVPPRPPAKPDQGQPQPVPVQADPAQALVRGIFERNGMLPPGM